MIKKLLISSLLLTASVCAYPSDVTVCFSPHQNCLAKIIDVMDNAKKSIYMHAYSFTSPEIAQALINAKQRGIDVCLYIDKGRDVETYSQTKNLRENGVDVIVQNGCIKGLAHNKIMIVDEELILTGSFNWTKNALRNEENINFINSPDLASVYLQNWKKTIKVSEE